MDIRPSLAEIEAGQPFAGRHIGTAGDAQAKMLATVGYASLEDLMRAAPPRSVTSPHSSCLPRPPRPRSPPNCVPSPGATPS